MTPSQKAELMTRVRRVLSSPVPDAVKNGGWASAHEYKIGITVLADFFRIGVGVERARFHLGQLEALHRQSSSHPKPTAVLLNSGGPEGANSAAPKGRGQGMGSMPMKDLRGPVALHIPDSIYIPPREGLLVGQSPIETAQQAQPEGQKPGPSGARPVSVRTQALDALRADKHRASLAARLLSPVITAFTAPRRAHAAERCDAAGAAGAFDTPPSNTGVNEMSGGQT